MTSFNPAPLSYYDCLILDTFARLLIPPYLLYDQSQHLLVRSSYDPKNFSPSESQVILIFSMGVWTILENNDLINPHENNFVSEVPLKH
jgi:hypothetical protein